MRCQLCSPPPTGLSDNTVNVRLVRLPTVALRCPGTLPTAALRLPLMLPACALRHTSLTYVRRFATGHTSHTYVSVRKDGVSLVYSSPS